MKYIVRALVAATILLGPAVGVAAAADIRDLLLLKENGLSDDILIQLIRSDGSVFHLTAADLIDLNKKGLSERVLSAMLATAPVPAATVDQTTQPATDAALSAVTDVPDAPMEDRARVEVPPDQTSSTVPEPTPAPITTSRTASAPSPAPTPAPEIVYVPVPVPVVVERHHPAPPPTPPAPVYWGYGGQKKPGSWDEPTPPTPPQSGKPTPPRGGRGGI